MIFKGKKDCVEACIVLHNMMVKETVAVDEEESNDFYKIVENDHNDCCLEIAEIDGKDVIVDEAIEAVLDEDEEIEATLNWEGDRVYSKVLKRAHQKQLLQQHMCMVQQ
jgi:hypothetical protein